jgi:hypothetical protein
MRGKDHNYERATRLGPPWSLAKDASDIVLGRRAVITAFDSGPARVFHDETARGWRQAGDVLITAPIPSHDDIVGALSDAGSEI